MKNLLLTATTFAFALSSAPLFAASCDKNAYKTNTNDNGKVRVEMRNETGDPTWVIVKKYGSTEKLSSTWDVVKRHTFGENDGKDTTVETIFRRTSERMSKQITCTFAFDVENGGKEFTFQGYSCETAADLEPTDVNFDCSRSYASGKHRMTFKLAVQE